VAGRKRQRRRALGVSASELAQMGVCERLVKFEHDCGRRRTAEQLLAMERGRRAHQRLYRHRHGGGQRTGRCFVATLVFGQAREIRVLRRFRDRVLRPRQIGRRLIVLYYRIAPAVCRLLERWPNLQPVVRWMLRGVVCIAARRLEWEQRHHVR
jgi:hypothetical protein